MVKRIAVEDTISAIGDHLEEQGFEVDRVDMSNLTGDQLKNYSVLVISGQDSNMMGMEDITAGVPVIQAVGKTPAQVAQMVRERLEYQLSVK
ncbi:MAG: YkuS family protein [Thermoanaerobacteraceae bacterium]|uniref:YkuS family protein n=1 Tax=Thermanaeromonas sp. C210 TaxID=2731925 RepID=UPI00155CD86E|nr:YkuS family protein [Thermanaeromonas sp. C210]MBE3582050.1 YkuS family protein [Thermoanaerobacteraceae bacterium]GFN22705.1 hypothetical protein TAMC210_10210 [Thermanaeromonas sp. C210]